jgi:N-6 DNA Methylase
VELEERELITAAGIARLAGVGRAAVSNWRKRYPEFPKPTGGSPNSPTFDRAEVVTWLNATGKADQLATAGRTDGGTLRLSAPSVDATGMSIDAIFSEAWKLLPERSVSDLRPRDLLARAMVALLPRSIAPDRTGHASNVAAGGDEAGLEGSAADRDLPVVVDPACGAAAALMAVADRFGGRVRLAGQDIDESAARTAAFNLSGNARCAPYEVHTGDSFTDSQLDAYLGRAAAVVCEPPFDRPEWPMAELTTDRRWEFGIPAPRDGELAWVQHCYAHLRPHGIAVVAVSQRACVASSGEHIRAALVRAGVLRAVIALPAPMSFVPGNGICLWVLRRPAATPGAPRTVQPAVRSRPARGLLSDDDSAAVWMIDLSGLGDPADVPQEHAAWLALVSPAAHRSTGRGGDLTIVRAVERLELLDEGTRLLPSRYLTPRAEASADNLKLVTGRLAGIHTAVGHGLPRFGAPKTPVRLAYVTLAELERVGALTVRARDDTPRMGDVLLRTQGRMPVVAATITDKDGSERFGEVTGIAQVIEIDSSRLNPHFVALFLRSDVGALPVANTLGAINRDDLRRCRIPRMPLAEQRRYGDAFRLLTELEQALATLSDLSAKVIEQTIYALTTGAVAPEYELPAAGRFEERDKHEEKERRQ